MDTFLAFTLKSNGILSTLETDALIDSNVKNGNNLISKDKKWRGLWDTGASKSSIDKRVVDELGLIPVGKGTISTANGIVLVNTYFIDLTLPNRVTIKDILVTCADLGEDIDVLIGMDVIQHGDFSITNINGATTFSFRIPSVEEIDYVQESNKNLQNK